MKFRCSVEINKPIDQVIDLFDNIDNLKHWQEGFQRLESISGVPGELGSKSRIFLKQGGREMELIETILVKDLPNEQIGMYEHIHMDNLMTNRFFVINDKLTKWETEIEYTAFKSFIPRIMAMLFPSLFKKPVQKWLDRFNDFTEKE